MKIDKKVGEAQRCAGKEQMRTEAWTSATKPLESRKYWLTQQQRDVRGESLQSMWLVRVSIKPSQLPNGMVYYHQPCGRGSENRLDNFKAGGQEIKFSGPKDLILDRVP